MFRTSSEQRELNTQVALLLDNTAAVLQEPDIAAALGPVTDQVLDWCDNAFAPNVRNGRYSVPRRRQSDGHMAVIVLTDRQAQESEELIEPLLSDDSFVWSEWAMGDGNPYGIELTYDEVRMDVSPPVTNFSIEKVPVMNGLKTNTIARTTINLNWNDDEPRYFGSRPVMVIRDKVLGWSALSQAAIVEHETIHAIDAATDGPYYFNPQYAASSELRGYHGSATLFGADAFRPQDAEHSLEVEKIRQEVNHRKPYPFQAPDFLVQQLLGH